MYIKMKREIINLTVPATIFGKKKTRRLTARVDTGATKSSLDVKLASSLSLGPIIRTKLVKSAQGSSIRPVIKAKIKIKNKKILSEFTLADRQNLKYKILIGQNVLRKARFLIDPCKK